jgi:SAM-dependent methyltransferase
MPNRLLKKAHLQCCAGPARLASGTFLSSLIKRFFCILLKGRPTKCGSRHEMSAMSLETIPADFDRIARLAADEPERPDRYESFLLAQVPALCTRVLEIGCGAGRLARAIARRGATVTGIDASPEMIRLARHLSPDNARIEFVCGDFSVHPMGSELYDCVVSVTTLHHLPAAPTLARMKGLLKPDGVLVIHDVRSPSGISDWLLSGLVAVFNGDAAWWIRTRLREKRVVRAAWHDHGSGERYLTMVDVRAVCETLLPSARIYWHPLWRYTVVWTRGKVAA